MSTYYATLSVLVTDTERIRERTSTTWILRGDMLLSVVEEHA